MHKHIILVGFKHTGKSVIGKSLAKKLCVPFIDLDQQIEYLYENKYSKKQTCREIMLQYGEDFFQALETQSIIEIMDLNPSVLSFGGGSPLVIQNQKLIESQILVHVTAQRGIVFERILMSGRPAFFNPDEDLLQSFNRLWDKRVKVYDQIKHFSIENNSTVDVSVNNIINTLIDREQYFEKNSVDTRR